MWKPILIAGTGLASIDWSVVSQLTPERIALAAGFAGWAWASFRKSSDAKSSQELTDANVRIQLKDGEIKDLTREKEAWQKEKSELKEALGQATGKLAILEQYDGKAVVEALGAALTSGMTSLQTTLDTHMSMHTEQLQRIEVNTKPQRAPSARSRKTDKP